MAVDMDDFELEKLRAEIHQERQMKEMLEQSAAELRATVEELEKRYDSIDNEGNEWKTRFETQQEINGQLERQILNLQNKVQEARSNLKDGKGRNNKDRGLQDKKTGNDARNNRNDQTKAGNESLKQNTVAMDTRENDEQNRKNMKTGTTNHNGGNRSENRVTFGGHTVADGHTNNKKIKLQTSVKKMDKETMTNQEKVTQTIGKKRQLYKKKMEKESSVKKSLSKGSDMEKTPKKPKTVMVMHKATQVSEDMDVTNLEFEHLSDGNASETVKSMEKHDVQYSIPEDSVFDNDFFMRNAKLYQTRTKPGSYLRARAFVAGRDLTSGSSGQASKAGSSKSNIKPNTALTKTTGITIDIAISPRIEEAGKSPRDLRNFDDLSDANPHMIRLLDKEKNVLSSQLRDMEWRLDQESKAYHKANDERKTYSLEINATKGSITELSSRSKLPLTARDADAGSRMSRAMGNIPEDQRILDPKKGPIRKTAGVKNLPSLETT